MVTNRNPLYGKHFLELYYKPPRNKSNSKIEVLTIELTLILVATSKSDFFL